MIDNFAIALTHFLLALVALRLAIRSDLDRDPEDGGESVPNGLNDKRSGQPVRRQMEVRRG